MRAAREAIHCTRTAAAFAAALDKIRPDVIHCHNIYGRLTTSILPVARRRGIPVVLTAHDYKLVCPAYLALRDGKPCTACVDGNYMRCAVHKCHKKSLAGSVVYAAEAYYARLNNSYGAVKAFLCPSRFLADLLLKSGIESKRIIYHPNSVDPRLYKPSYNGEYVLYTGRLSHEKGIGTLVDAIKYLPIPLRIAGSGPMEEALRARAGDALGSRIIFEGHCGGDRLAELYRNAAFCVVPSEWYENAPMSVLEAFAYGKPVIAARIGGIPELVTDRESGYLYESGDGNQLRMAIRELWNDKFGQQRMGSNARWLIESKYSQRTRIESLLKIYEDVRNPGSKVLTISKPLGGLLFS
jgi:glycosyltransferase involved in cell wall biosynthesis